jgi:hypothetical protein
MTYGLVNAEDFARIEREARRLRAETMRAMIRGLAARLRAPFASAGDARAA